MIDQQLQQQLPPTPGEAQTEDEEFASIIASINPKRLEELALTTRRQLFDGLPSTRPRAGSYNIVYKLSFSNGVKWAIRSPAEGDVYKPSRIRSLHLDIITQRFISLRPLYRYLGFTIGPWILAIFSRAPLSSWTSFLGQTFWNCGTTGAGSRNRSGRKFLSRPQDG